jgi:hypothetical protein
MKKVQCAIHRCGPAWATLNGALADATIKNKCGHIRD